MAKRIQKRPVKANQGSVNYQRLLKQNKSLIAANKRLTNKNKILTNKLKASNNKNKTLTNKLKVSNNKNKKMKQNIKAMSEQEYKNNYQLCPKDIYRKYDNDQSNGQIANFSRRFDENKLKRELNNLNTNYRQKSIPDKHVNKIINNKIGNQISGGKFLKSVQNSVNNINKTWPNHQINLLKTELNKIDYSNFNFDDPLSNLKMDSLLDLLITPSNNFKTPNSSIKILGIKNCTKTPLINQIKFIDPNSNTQFIFNKDFIKKKISKNIGIINAFYKMLQKFTDIGHLELTELITKINDMIDTTNIYFCDMPINTCGMTISNGDIYISGDYLYEVLGETTEYKNLKVRDKKIYYQFTAVCKIYLTLLHELAHKLHYLVRKKESKNDTWKDNFFDHSEEINLDDELEYFIDINGTKTYQTKKYYRNIHINKILDESGDFFDRELYLGTPITDVDNNTCDFFLSNRCSSYNSYINRFNNIRNGISNNSTTRASNSKFKIIGNQSRCHFSILRHS